MSITGYLREQADYWKPLVRWLWVPRQAWMALLMVVAVIMWIRLLRTEPAVRITGGFLQLLGVITVIYGLHVTQRFFGRPGLITAFAHWVAQFPYRVWDLPAANAVGAIVIKDRGYGYSVNKASPGADPETRIDLLEKNLVDLLEYASTLHKMIDDKANQASARLKQEAEKRHQQNRKVLEQLESFATNGIMTSAVGAFWLFLGIILSTLSPELGAWLATT